MSLIGCGDVGGFAVREDEVCFEDRDGRPVCIETYEASRADASEDLQGTSTAPPRSSEGRMPWVELSWQEAFDACRSKAKRLCTREEWIDACDGGIGAESGTRFVYGDVVDLDACHVSGTSPEPTGFFGNCESGLGTFDQGGNVWEWTGDSVASASARGGGFRSSGDHDCSAGDQGPRFDINAPDPEVGFRCCRDD